MYFEVSFTDDDGFTELATYAQAGDYIQEIPPANTPAEFTLSVNAVISLNPNPDVVPRHNIRIRI